MFNMQSFLRSVAIALPAVLLTGCGGSDLDATVDGTVTLNGTPLETGTITFEPADGKAPTAQGKIENGKYSFGVAPGPKKVKVNSSKVVGEKKAYAGDPNSPTIPITEEVVPPKYNTKTELSYEVKPGAQTYDIPLEGTRKK